jgi:hypothetical protein
MSNFNNYTNSVMFDLIDDLPSDNKPLTNNEKVVIDTFFIKKKINFFNEMKDIIIIIILYLILSIPSVDFYINKFIKISQKSYYILAIIKAFIFAIFFCFLKNFYLSNK